MAAAALGVLELPAATVAPLCTTMTEGLLVAATTPRGVTVAPPVAKLLGCSVLVRGEAALNPPVYSTIELNQMYKMWIHNFHTWQACAGCKSHHPWRPKGRRAEGDNTWRSGNRGWRCRSKKLWPRGRDRS